jgi:RNA polymerase sigma factor (sigma-70 family)
MLPNGDLPSNSISQATPERFRDLVASAGAGSEEAINQIIAEYTPFILLAIRRRLPPGDPVRRALDSVDVQQVVLAHLAEALRDGTVPSDEQVFRAFVAEMAANTARSEIRRQTAQKRSVYRRQSLDNASFAVAAKEPDPAEIAECREDWARFVRGLPRVYRRIVEMRAVGWTAPQIAEELGLCRRSVEYILKKQWCRWQKIRSGGGAQR